MLSSSNLFQRVCSVAGHFFNPSLKWLTGNTFKTSILQALLDFHTFLKPIQSFFIIFDLETKWKPHHNSDISKKKMLQDLPVSLDGLLAFNWFEGLITQPTLDNFRKV